MGKIEISIIALLIVFGLFSCEEYQQGCMDASATNFKVSNQSPCCCEYPNLIFQTTLTDGDEIVPFSDTLTNKLGQHYLIRDLRFIASEITVSDSLNAIYKPTDTFNNYLISPDILAVDVLNLNSVGSNFMYNGRFDKINFTVGVISDLQDKVPRDFPIDHPFQDSLFYDFNKQDWVMARARIEVIDQEVVEINLTGSDLPVSVHIPGEWEKPRGRDLTMNLRIDVTELFGGMDFSLPESDLRREFGANLVESLEP